jgi:hypothetical protein
MGKARIPKLEEEVETLRKELAVSQSRERHHEHLFYNLDMQIAEVLKLADDFSVRLNYLRRSMPPLPQVEYARVGRREMAALTESQLNTDISAYPEEREKIVS